MVPVYEFDDIEFRPFHWTGRVVGHCDGSRDTSVEGIEGILEGWALSCELGGRVYILFFYTLRRGLGV